MRKKKQYSMVKDILEWIACIVIALVIALTFKFYIGTPTMVQMPSMYPTLQEGQRLWLNRTIRITKKIPARGDIVTFEAPTTLKLSSKDIQESVIARYEEKKLSIFEKFNYYVLENDKKSYIKRVIGLPGEHVVIQNGKVYINDEKLDESYLKSGIVTDSYGGNCIDISVPDNTIFVMGDNRTESLDSRCFGCVPIEKIESTVGIRIWPLNLFGKVG